MALDDTPGFDTLAIHAGAAPDPTTGARATPIYQTTSFVFDDVDHAASLFGLQAFGNIYTRIMNPTQAVLEEKVAALEGGTAALATSSGHGAQLLAFHTMMEPGDEFVALRQLYGGSINQFNHSFKSFDWKVNWADADDLSSIEKAVTAKTKAIFCESIANPGGLVTDLEGISKIARRAGVPLDRRQHPGNPLSVPPNRTRRRLGHPFAHQVHGWPRQLHGRHDRGCGHLQLVPRRALSQAVRAVRELQRHAAA